MDNIILLIAIAVVFLVCVGLFILVYLFKHRSVATRARIVAIEQKEKYYDSTKDKRIAYDYVYVYTDHTGKSVKGILYKNVPRIEYSINDELPIRYLKDKPEISIFEERLRLLGMIPYITVVMFAVLLLLWIL